MHREYLKTYSSPLQREMEALIFGHGGAAVLVFPTSRGRFYQWEDFRVVEALREPIERGWLQLFCVDGIDNETWYDFERPVDEILEVHQLYENYLTQEFMPQVLRARNHSGFVICTGTSFGAFHALSFGTRHPDQVNRIVAMSGDFDSSKYLDDDCSGPAYFYNPMAYLPRVTPGIYMDHLRQLEFRLAVGSDDFCLEPSERLAGILGKLGLRVDLQVWDAHWIHDWPTWRVMARVLL